MSGRARQIWFTTLPALLPGLVRPVDATALGMYCTAVAEWLDAREKVAELGLLVPGRHDGLVMNPACRIEQSRYLQPIVRGWSSG